MLAVGLPGLAMLAAREQPNHSSHPTIKPKINAGQSDVTGDGRRGTGITPSPVFRPHVPVLRPPSPVRTPHQFRHGLLWHQQHMQTINGLRAASNLAARSINFLSKPDPIFIQARNNRQRFNRHAQLGQRRPPALKILLDQRTDPHDFRTSGLGQSHQP